MSALCPGEFAAKGFISYSDLAKVADISDAYLNGALGIFGSRTMAGGGNYLLTPDGRDAGAQLDLDD